MDDAKLKALIEGLLRKSEGEIHGYIQKVDTHLEIASTKALAHCYFIALDGNGRPRINDFAEFVARHVVDYAIPRKEIAAAQKYDTENNTTTAHTALVKKAAGLFTSLEKTGEGGEMLLYILVQEFLKLPQLICKMPLKTNSEMHYHGADGIHVSVEENADGKEILSLYWGESKLYKDLGKAIKAAIESIKGFLLSDGSAGTPAQRDLQLIQDNLHVVDEKLGNALLKYLDKDDPLYGQVNWKGICLIGFDTDHYPATPNSGETIKQIKEKIEKELPKWSEKVGKQISEHTNLNTFDIHVFLLPFPSVEAFRKAFLEALGLKYEPSAEDL